MYPKPQTLNFRVLEFLALVLGVGVGLKHKSSGQALRAKSSWLK